jgi:hypothetical protein
MKVKPKPREHISSLLSNANIYELNMVKRGEKRDQLFHQGHRIKVAFDKEAQVNYLSFPVGF